MQYYQCITKGFAGTIARRVALSQVNWAEKEMWWQHHYHLARTGNWKSSIRERTESNVTKVPLTAGVFGEEGQAKVQRRKCYGLMPLALQHQNHITSPKKDTGA